MSRIAINGRFLTQGMTGVQRFATEIVAAADALALAGDWPAARVLHPAGARQAGLHAFSAAAVGARSGQAWEQIDLPRARGDDFLVNLGNTAPLFVGARQAVVIHDDGAGFAACEKAPVPHAASPLPCKHALGLRELLKLAQIGLHHLTLLTGDCGSCPRARTGQMFEAALALHQSMRSSRGEDAIGVHLVQEPAAYHAAKRGSHGAPARVDSRKRALFTGLFRRSHARPRALPASALAAYAPVFDLEKCTACDACARICPDGALLRERGAAAGYRIFPELCSGCGLCVDLCDDEAMRLESPAAAAPSFVPLEARHCRACGVSFAWIAARPRDQQTECPVCRKTMRTRQLFQVLRDP